MKNSNYLLRLVWLFVLFTPATAFTQQHFKFNYKFKNSVFLKANLKMINDPISETETGYVLIDGKENPVMVVVPSTNPPTQQEIYKSLLGVIDRRTGDKLYIHFYDIINSIAAAPAATYVDLTDNGKSFEYTITNWKKGKKFNVPFKYKMLTATSLPFRINFSTGDTEAEFLNFNAAFLWVNGRTKFFKNEDIDPRNFQFGFGPYLGLINIPLNDKNEFGITYGATVLFSVHKINLVGAFGLSNGFSKETKPTVSYLGFGIGFNLVELYDPTN